MVATMEVTLAHSSFLIASLILLLFVLRHVMKKSRPLGGAAGEPPPGPFQLPIIGSLHHLLGSLPHLSLAALSNRFGPVMLLKLCEVPTLIISSAEAAAEIMRTHDISFSTRPILFTVKMISPGSPGIAFAPYGQYWRELRKMSIVELLSVKRVRSFRSIRKDEVLRFVSELSSSASAVNLSRRFILLTNDIAARSIIGRKCRYQKDFLRILTTVLQSSGGFNLPDLFPSSSLVSLLTGKLFKFRRVSDELDGILSSIIQEHRESKNSGDQQTEEDMVDVMLRVQAQGSLPFPLTDGSIKAIILDLFGAGSETSATTMEWAMSELVRNARTMKRVQEEVRGVVGEKGRVTEEDINQMSYLRLVIKETMRLHPPLPLLLPRECQDEMEVFGYRIPAKTRVMVNAWALGRDGRYWGEDAGEFRPERFEGKSPAVDFKGANFEFLPFGAGRRMCPGISFGMASVELPLASLLYHFDWETAGGAPPEELDMAETFLLTCHRRTELCLRAVPRYACLSDGGN